MTALVDRVAAAIFDAVRSAQGDTVRWSDDGSDAPKKQARIAARAAMLAVLEALCEAKAAPRAPAGFTWTQELDAVLAREWSGKKPAAEIAAALGTTKNAVIGRANRLHLPPRAGRAAA